MATIILPDTNAVIAYFDNHAGATARFESAFEIVACSPVVGELYYGARYSTRMAENVARVDAFVAVNFLIECDLETARNYGTLKAALRKKGRMIPDNDLWIATIALQHDVTLMTDDAHFRQVDGLQVVGW